MRKLNTIIILQTLVLICMGLIILPLNVHAETIEDYGIGLVSGCTEYPTYYDCPHQSYIYILLDLDGNYSGNMHYTDTMSTTIEVYDTNKNWIIARGCTATNCSFNATIQYNILRVRNTAGATRLNKSSIITPINTYIQYNFTEGGSAVLPFVSKFTPSRTTAFDESMVSISDNFNTSPFFWADAEFSCNIEGDTTEVLVYDVNTDSPSNDQFYDYLVNIAQYPTLDIYLTSHIPSSTIYINNDENISFFSIINHPEVVSYFVYSVDGEAVASNTSEFGYTFSPTISGTYVVQKSYIDTCGQFPFVTWNVIVNGSNESLHNIEVSVTRCTTSTSINNINCTLYGESTLNTYYVNSSTGTCIFNDIETDIYTLKIFAIESDYIPRTEIIEVNTDLSLDYCLSRGANISGYILDDTTYEPIPNASISIIGIYNTYNTTSNDDGYYNIHSDCGLLYMFNIEIYAINYLPFYNYCHTFDHPCEDETMDWFITTGKSDNFTWSGTIVNNSLSPLNNTIVKLIKPHDLRNITTNGTGKFEFLNISDGYAQIFIENLGYISSTYVHTFGVDECGNLEGTDIINRTYTLLSLGETKWYSLNITILNYLSNESIPNVRVIVMHPMGDTYTEYTNSDGIVNFIVLQEGTWTIILDKNGYETIPSTVHLLEKNDTIILYLHPSAETLNTFAGNIVSAYNGEWIDSAIISLYKYSNGTTITTFFQEYTTSSIGYFMFYQIPDGYYLINISHQYFNTHSENKLLTDSIYNYEIELSPKGSFYDIYIMVYEKPSEESGCTGTMCRISNADVKVYNNDFEKIQYTDNNGYTFFFDIFQGNYYIEVSKDGYITKITPISVYYDRTGGNSIEIELTTGSSESEIDLVNWLTVNIPTMFIILLFMLMMNGLLSINK